LVRNFAKPYGCSLDWIVRAKMSPYT